MCCTFSQASSQLRECLCECHYQQYMQICSNEQRIVDLKFPASEIQLLIWNALDFPEDFDKHMQTIRTYQNLVLVNGLTIWNLLQQEENVLNGIQRQFSSRSRVLLELPSFNDYHFMMTVQILMLPVNSSASEQRSFSSVVFVSSLCK